MQFILDETFLNKLMSKLAELPYAEVAELFDEAKTAIKRIEKE